jgi:hypothetical protein
MTAAGAARACRRTGEGGLAMVAVLATTVIVMTIAVALVGLMNTDLLHASIHDAVSRSYYIAQAGLEEAIGAAARAADPVPYHTPKEGVTAAYGGGRYTYWVDAGPAAGCGPGLKTLEALGEVPLLGRAIPSRVRACGIGGTPQAVALFGVSRVEFQGDRTRAYLAPYGARSPGNGASLGSFTEVRFADPGIRLNALSETAVETLTLRDDDRIPDYGLFGFAERPDYNPDPTVDPTPWVLSVFGEIVKARPLLGETLSPCGTPYACVTAPLRANDIEDAATLRGPVGQGTESAGLPHVYMQRTRKAVLPLLSLDPAAFASLAAENTANDTINRAVGLSKKTTSVYTPFEFYEIVAYLDAHGGERLRGTIYVSGTVQLVQDLDLGGSAGDVTLAVAGDLILAEDVRLANRHDLSTAAGRQRPGILVFGFTVPAARPTPLCRGQAVNGSGRLVLCGGSRQRLTVDGLIYTTDGMAVGPGASVDQIGAMYHGNRGTSNPSFASENATVVLRFDPLALSVFGRGLSILSWQQLH